MTAPMFDTHNTPRNDAQLWAMVFGDETPADVSGTAEFHGLPRVCHEALTAAQGQGIDLAGMYDESEALEILIRMARK